MRAAIIGYGSIARVHEEIIREKGTLVALADVKARPEGIDVPYYTDYKKMMDEVSPDVVHICTPHYLHTEMIAEALKRNINVLSEKPLCIREEDIDLILEAEEKSEAQLGICFQNRYNSPNRYVKEYIRDKKVLGASGTVIWKRDSAYYRSAEWRGTLDREGGGTLINQAIHTLDLIQWLVGDPDAVVANISNMTHGGEIEVEDTVDLVCEGRVGFTLHATTSAPVSFPTEIVLMLEGNETVRIMPRFAVIGDRTLTFDANGRIYGKECYGAGHVGLIEDFYDCIRENRPFEINGKEAAKVMRTVFSAYKSHGKKTEIRRY